MIAVVALSAMAVVAFMLKRTRLGRAMRAISDDPDLAEVRGIGRARTVDWTWAISGVLTALAGVMIALDGIVDPTDRHELSGFGFRGGRDRRHRQSVSAPWPAR